ncbi:hypothetical protein B566_EDAN018064 [Ephemera danica]|nr:hypothetical protein B566_EDAN018064 [Ephemera danica]
MKVGDEGNSGRRKKRAVDSRRCVATLTNVRVQQNSVTGPKFNYDFLETAGGCENSASATYVVSLDNIAACSPSLSVPGTKNACLEIAAVAKCSQQIVLNPPKPGNPDCVVNKQATPTQTSTVVTTAAVTSTSLLTTTQATTTLSTTVATTTTPATTTTVTTTTVTTPATTTTVTTPATTTTVTTTTTPATTTTLTTTTTTVTTTTPTTTTTTPTTTTCTPVCPSACAVDSTKVDANGLIKNATQYGANLVMCGRKYLIVNYANKVRVPY